jgi:hypothetical protein
MYLMMFLSISLGCGTQVMVPPRIDLMHYEQVGIVTFTIENAKGSIDKLATQRFVQEISNAQTGILILELGEQETVLETVNQKTLNAEAATAIGEHFKVPAVFVGHIVVSDVKPKVSLHIFPSVEAEVSVSLTIRLLSTETGATLWSNSAREKETVAGISLIGDMPYFQAEDPGEAYGKLVEKLIYQLTQDFRPTFKRV